MGTKNYTHLKKYGPFKGLNKGVSDLTLQEDFFSLAKNAFVQPGSTALTSRPGFKPHGITTNTTDVKIFCGLYIETDGTGMQYEKELFLNISSNRGEVVEPLEFSITNTTGQDLYFDVDFNELTTTWRAALKYVSNESILYSLAIESSTGVPSQTVNDLIAALDGLASITSVLTVGSGSNFAVTSLPAMRVLIPNGTSRSIKGVYAKTISINSSIVTDFGNTFSDADAAPISYTNLNGILYFALPKIGLCKFDGQAITRAGMPRAYPLVSYTQPTQTYAYSTAIQNGTYVYATAFEAKDSKGNIIEGLGEVTRRGPGSGPWSGANPERLGPGTFTYNAASDPDRPVFVINTLEDGGQFEVRGAIINGIQAINSSNLVINVTSNTLIAGDTACFQLKTRNGVGAPTNGVYQDAENHLLLVEAPITTATATTITLASTGWTVTHVGILRPTSGANTWRSIKNPGERVTLFQVESDVTIAQIDSANTGGATAAYVFSGQPISNNVKINIYRNKGEGTTDANYITDYPDLYLVDIIPNQPLASTTTWIDNTPDIYLNIAWEQKLPVGPVSYELTDGLAPNCTIVHNHQNRLYLAGNPEAVNTLYRSDLLYGEQFWNPDGTGNLNLETKVASKITAIGSTSDNLVVGKSRGIKLISGDLGSDTNIRIDDLSFELGLANQASTISAVDKCIALTQLGPIEITTGGQWNFLGSQDLGSKSRLEGVLKNGSYDLNFASAAINPEKGYYFLYLAPKGSSGPTEVQNESYLQFNQSPALLANVTFGSAYVYSLTQDAWFEWTRFDATGGAYIKDGLLHTVRTGSISSVLLRENASGTLSDFVDWYEAISFDVATNWITGGDPYAFKQFLRALIQNVETDALSVNDYTLTISAERDWTPDVAHSSVSISDLEKVGYGQLKIKGNKSRAMRIRLQHSALKKRPMISGLTIELAAPFRPKVKQE